MPTEIQWTDETWNVTTGCTKISPGCKNCYAERMTKRLKAMGNTKYAAGFDKVVCHPDTLEIPLRWKKPRRTFVDSMSDLFHEDVPDEFIDRAFAVMSLCPQHTFLVLTKRPERMAEYLSNRDWSDAANWAYDKFIRRLDRPLFLSGEIIPPLSNVHLGTTVENQAMAVERIPYLLGCPAAVRFLSCEPLLGPLDFSPGFDGPSDFDVWLGEERTINCEGCIPTPVRGVPDCPGHDGGGIDWVIIGCESGPNRRPCELEWVKSLVDQCDAAGVAPFVKQIPINGRVSKDFTEWPKWAQRREFPKESKS